MNIFKRCVAVLVLTGLCASNVQAAGFNFSGVDTVLKAAIVTSAAGLLGGAALIGSATYSAFCNGAVNSTVAAKFVGGTIVALGAAGLFKAVVAPFGNMFNP